mmetsp:Transcript_92297/g.169536  ORF Transcript_92297/g.169536 Transcript_92297/m.169536 type:complete len:674 (+) Transcript_92297:144-2165(+)
MGEPSGLASTQPLSRVLASTQPLSLETLTRTQASWHQRGLPRSTSVGGGLRATERRQGERRQGVQAVSLSSDSVRDDGQLIAAHFARQQARLRRNIIMVDSDDEWIRGMERNVSSRCGTFVFFRRHGCPSCNYMAPKVSEASNDFELQHGADISFIEVDVDKCQRTASRYKADTFVPAFCIFSHGELQSSFSGVSSGVFNEKMRNLGSSTTSCSRCTSGMRSSFDMLEEQLPAVIARGQHDGGQPLRTQTSGKGSDVIVPNGERILPFDISGIIEPARARLELLEERLRGRPSMWHYAQGGRHKALALEFLKSTTDDGLDVTGARHLAVGWLVARLGHISLWTPEERQAVTSIADAVIARRANRAEYWLLRSLSGIRGRLTALECWSSEIRKFLNEKLCGLWMSVRPCNAACDMCDMPCMLPRNHLGDHSCDVDDHSCHRLISDAAEDGSPPADKQKCCLHAGHSGPCRSDPVVVFDLGDQGTCAICLESMPRFMQHNCHDDAAACAECEPGTMIFTYPCKHTFHLRCVEPWLQRSCNCPLCRRPTHASKMRGTKLEAEGLGVRQHGSPQLRQLRPGQARTRSGWRMQARQEEEERPSLSAIMMAGRAANATAVNATASTPLGLPALPEIQNLAARVAEQALSSRSVSNVALPSLSSTIASGRGLRPPSGHQP